ncbi:hypothetical protein D9M68_546750 [compost metagenome]
MAELVAFRGVDLAEAVFVGHRVQDGIEPGHGVCQGSVEVKSGDVVFQVSNPVRGGRGRQTPLGWSR